LLKSLLYKDLSTVDPNFMAELPLKTSPDGTGKGFTASGATTFMDDLTLEMFLTTTLRENKKRRSVFEPQLLQPRFLPRVATVVLKSLKLIPQKKGTRNKEITA
jgi:hypothetical protein